MKSLSILLAAALLGSQAAVCAFQSTTATATSAAGSSSLFHQQQRPSFFRPRATGSVTLLQVATLDTSTTLDNHAALLRQPWDRVCSTVSDATSQLNTMRQKIAKSGVATALTYSLVSNAFTSVAVSLAWYGFSLQTGLSPLSPGQWKPFLTWYAGFYAVNSLLKPVRLVLALSVAKHTEQLMQHFQCQVFNDSKKAAIACATTLLVTTSSCIMATGIGVASLSSGIPIL